MIGPSRRQTALVHVTVEVVVVVVGIRRDRNKSSSKMVFSVCFRASQGNVVRRYGAESYQRQFWGGYQ